MAVVSDVEIQLLEPLERPFQWVRRRPATAVQPVLVRVRTDSQLEGQCLSWLLPGPTALSSSGLLLRHVIGKDPHHVEEISQALTDRLEAPTPLASSVDIALWDLLGKLHNEPIYRLLGAARDRLRAYASTVLYDDDQRWVDLALECRGQGFTAFKIHPYGEADDDIRLCRAVHAAVGDSMALMLDPVNVYDRREAAKVGRVLDDLGFHWYEAPLADSDMIGMRDLKRTLRTPISGCESIVQGLRAYPPYLSSGAVDSLRSVGDWIGGISAMRKAAALCEAFNVPYEPHHYGTVHIQAAHFHVSLASSNGEFVEVPVPLGVLDEYSLDSLAPDRDGLVPAPTKPGLGYDLDMERIEAATLQRVSASEARDD